MDLVDAPEHLLGDIAVVGVALERGPQLAQVVDLPKRHPEVSADAEAEREDLLGEDRARLRLEQLPGGARRVHGHPVALLEPHLDDLPRYVVAKRAAEQLT